MLSIKISDLMIAMFGNQTQDFENAARKLLYNISIDKSEGVQLDNIGTIVNQSRLGYNDTYYRILLKVKIGVNISEGEIERILTLWKLLAGTDNVKLIELFPAKIKLETDEYLGDDIFIFMKEFASLALAGGVGIDTIIVTDPTKFGFGPTMGNFNSEWASVY
jgi:hypothetical protein